MSSELEQEIQKKVQALPETKQQHLLALIEELLLPDVSSMVASPQEDGAPPSSARPVWEIFEGLSQQVSLQEWAKLPSDGAEQHDHYLYGAPKRKNP